ncbi:serine endoprotease DegQ [Algimonas ampicilliniresistens]|uniref:Serine endoprotease DegQ n=1 Tax=Algimonas ampicilliniresistens TaxID=1298735 RepID=A0ABQ5VB16_9PROT|nr:Do family serine endopeptidase [Algimonas ampicilliniresistens]GLQ24630.1 serine endoprotease DegQ [Algimonas ampicilliniresistens]
MKKALILSVAAIGLIATPVAMSQVLVDTPDQSAPAFQPVQLFGNNNSSMTFDSRRGVVTMAPLLAKVTPAVVSINTVTESPSNQMDDDQRELFERFFGQNPRSRGPRAGLGSGVIVDAREGLILTNNHVIDGADEIEVRLEDRREFMAEVIGADPKTDLALLKIDARNLTALDIADTDDVMVGDYVIAVGNPFGLSSTVTSGIVSALGRDNRASQDNYSDFIQTDAAINPGNSGGALVNSRGVLIGINTAIVSRSGSSAGIGFAVPTRIIRSVMGQLTEFGEVRRGRIGVLIGDLTPELREGLDLKSIRGALVSNVTEGSPAEKAGLESGDVVVAFNGEVMEDSSDLRNAVGLLSPGAEADITYIRDGKRRTTRITLEAIEDDNDVLDASVADDIPSMQSFSGATITGIPDDLDLRDGNEGVYISNVRRASRAARAGLQRGDIIRRINRTKLTDLKSFQTFIEDNDGPYALVVERDGQTAYLGVR